MISISQDNKGEGSPETPPGPSLVCQDCGELLPTTTMGKASLKALSHWRTCPKPGPVIQQRRLRSRMDEDIFPVSHSTLEHYERCPRSLLFSWEHGREAAGGAAGLGHAIHRWLETSTTAPDAEVPLEMASDARWLRLAAERLSERLTVTDGPPPALDATELSLNWHFALPDGRVAQFQGVIDRLQLFEGGGCRYLDYKSGSWLEREVENDVQGLTYAVLIRNNYGPQGSYDFTQVQFRSGELVRPSAPWSEAQVIEFEELLKAKAIQLATDREFAPKPGLGCKLCSFREVCDVGRQFTDGMAPLVTLQDAQAAAAARVKLETELKALDAALKEWCKQTQTTSIELPSGGSYGENVSPRLAFDDARVVMEILQNEHPEVDPLTYFSTTPTKLDRWLKAPDGDPTKQALLGVARPYKWTEWKVTPPPGGKRKVRR